MGSTVLATNGRADMERSNAFDYLGSINSAAEVVTEGTAMFSPEQLAGQYAFDAAKQADCGFDAATLEAHLDLLEEAGAKFDRPAALQVAQEFAAQ